MVKIDHVTGEVLIKGQKIARLNKEKLTLYVKALSESIDDNLQPVGQLITPEGYLVKLDDGRSISDRVFNIIGDTNGKYKVAVAKLADVGGDLLSGLKTKLANKLDDTQWKKFEVDFGNNTDLLKKFDENPELVDSWKVISNSPHSTDLDFIKFFDDVIKDGDVRVFFTVEGKNGVDIEDISAYGPSFDPSYSESEILFKSGLEFKVSNFEDTFDGSGNRLVLITLTE
ncbi:conserved hypothetical protein [Tenacibaculum maritimum]|nr:conserved hypothetical protein [Tenacibaculum maritimum]